MLEILKQILIAYLIISLFVFFANILSYLKMIEMHEDLYCEDTEGRKILKFAVSPIFVFISAIASLIPINHATILVTSLKIMANDKFCNNFINEFIEKIEPMYNDFKKMQSE